MTKYQTFTFLNHLQCYKHQRNKIFITIKNQETNIANN